MFLKADQTELVSGKYDAVFSITYVASVGWFGQVGPQREQQEQEEGF